MVPGIMLRVHAFRKLDGAQANDYRRFGAQFVAEANRGRSYSKTKL